MRFSTVLTWLAEPVSSLIGTHLTACSEDLRLTDNSSQGASSGQPHTTAMDPQKRKEELDRQIQERRQKLADMRLAREQRQKILPLAPLPSSSLRINAKSNASDVETRVDTEQDVDALVASLVGSQKVHEIVKNDPVPDSPVVMEKPSKIMYDKNIQTVGDDQDGEGPLIKRIFDTIPRLRKSLANDMPHLSPNPTEMVSHMEESVENSEEPVMVHPLSQAELKQISSSSDYQEFIDLAVRIVERTLNDEFDVLKDYTVEDDVQDGYALPTWKLTSKKQSFG
jgi:hypothetical protein